MIVGAALSGCQAEPITEPYSTFIRGPAAEPPAMVVAAPEDTGCVVYFDVNSAAIRADQVATIDRCAALYASVPQVHLALEGHADERGPTNLNAKLGERRAQAVQQELILRGIAPERLSVASFGEESFPEIRGDELLWSRSRRVDFAQR